MAEHKLSGTTVLLYIDPLGGVAYDTVVCLTSQSWSGTTNIIDATSKCGPDSLPGTQTNTVAFEGQHLYDPSAGKLSGVSLFDLWQGKTTVGWKISPAIPVEGDEILSGTGFISELSKTYGQTDPATFTGTLSIYGTTTQTVTTS